MDTKTQKNALCPNYQDLVEFADPYSSSLPMEQMNTISAHVKSCEHCSQNISDLTDHFSYLYNPPEYRPFIDF